ncbi:hypothetical protein M513_10960 [Trichuris suis]|uniref:Uncharacterized protein n=1 Tax=Trichuris suis TaxID=68888 RepID=A0A085LT78_9BILA|nr:hypothetical protein M513_10960 [Trichuris suis]
MAWSVLVPHRHANICINMNRKKQRYNVIFKVNVASWSTSRKRSVKTTMSLQGDSLSSKRRSQEKLADLKAPFDRTIDVAYS